MAQKMRRDKTSTLRVRIPPHNLALLSQVMVKQPPLALLWKRAEATLVPTAATVTSMALLSQGEQIAWVVLCTPTTISMALLSQEERTMALLSQTMKTIVALLSQLSRTSMALLSQEERTMALLSQAMETVTKVALANPVTTSMALLSQEEQTMALLSQATKAGLEITI